MKKKLHKHLQFLNISCDATSHLNKYMMRMSADT